MCKEMKVNWKTDSCSLLGALEKTEECLKIATDSAFNFK
jgi:hypothetical protein